MAQVDVRHLSVEINGKPVLQDVNMKFHTRERILVLGESGSGKSTLLLSLMGIVQRFDNADVKGDVLIDGVSVMDMDLPEVARVFGVVFQNPESQFCSLYPKDEIAFGLENQCIEPSMMDEIIKSSMQAYDFPMDKQDRQINSLSGGEQQRLALSSISALGSEMLLMDEPTANLDPQGQRQVVESAGKAAGQGKGLMVVEHNLENWLPFLNRLIVVDWDGSILCDGHIRDMFNTYGDMLKEKGIWCPNTIRIYSELKDRGHSFNKVPCNISELNEEKIPKALIEEVVDRCFGGPSGPIEKQAGKPLLVVEKLTAGYKRNQVILKGIDLTVREGDFYALVGGNGSGKSTLSKIIMRLVDMSDGHLSIAGKNLSAYGNRELYDLIGYVFQNPEHQFLEDTVWSEIAYSVDQLMLDESSRKQEVDCLLEAFHLTDQFMSNPFSLSGGQKRRLSVATMLVGERKILILDEPTFGQDEKNTMMLMEKLAELNHQGMTILMITHDLNLVDRYADRTAVMHDGRIIYDGDTQDLWKKNDIIKKGGLELPYRVKLMQEVKA